MASGWRMESSATMAAIENNCDSKINTELQMPNMRWISVFAWCS